MFSSQGFCCKCPNKRGQKYCQNNLFYTTYTAHCLRMSSLWYKVYSINNFYYTTKLYIKIYEKIIVVNTTIKKIVIKKRIQLKYTNKNHNFEIYKNFNITLNFIGDTTINPIVKIPSNSFLLVPYLKIDNYNKLYNKIHKYKIALHVTFF